MTVFKKDEQLDELSGRAFSLWKSGLDLPPGEPRPMDGCRQGGDSEFIADSMRLFGVKIIRETSKVLGAKDTDVDCGNWATASGIVRSLPKKDAIAYMQEALDLDADMAEERYEEAMTV